MKSKNLSDLDAAVALLDEMREAAELEAYGNKASARGGRAARAKWKKTDNRTLATQAARDAAVAKLNDMLIAKYGLDVGADDFSESLQRARQEHFSSLAEKSAAARKKKIGQVWNG